MTEDARRTSPDGWAFNLAVFRVSFISLVAIPAALKVLAWSRDVLPRLPAGIWDPVSFYQLLPHAVIANAALAQCLLVADLVLLLLALVGYNTRASLVAAAAVSLYVFGLPANQGKVDHFYHHVTWFLVLLAASPCHLALSFDARLPHRAASVAAASSDDALRALRFVWLLLGALYLGPGIAKLVQALGAGWSTPENLRHIMWRKWFEVVRFDGPHFMLRADRWPPLLVGLSGWCTIGFELLTIIVLQVRRVRPWWALLGIAFHLGNGLILHIWFLTLIPVYLGAFDWASLLGKAGVSAASRRSRVLPLLGASLLSAELCVSAVMYFYRSQASLPSPLRWAVNGAGWRAPVWPFDLYPTFADLTPASVEVWQPTWLMRSGEAKEVLPGTWRRASGNSALTWALVSELAGVHDTVELRRRSLDLAGLLLNAEDGDVRRDIEAVRIDRVTYLLDGTEPGFASETGRRQLMILPAPAPAGRR